MASGGIIDVGAGAAQAIGRYFSVISVVPSSFYVVFVYLLITAGAYQHSPNWSHAFAALGHLGVTGIGLLAFFSIGLGVIIHPIQLKIIQFFEGYWGIGSIAQALRKQRILHYQLLCRKLRGQVTDGNMRLRADCASAVVRAQIRSRYDEARRIRETDFPRALEEVMPTRLGNVLRRAESQAGSQYGLDALQAVPHLLLIAPDNHVDYVNDQRSQLDLAIRMTFMSVVASVTAVIFLLPRGLWVLVAIIPYLMAYMSYRGAIVAAQHYGSALDTLINLDRFLLYENLRLKTPVTTKEERKANKKMKKLFNYDDGQVIEYELPAPGGGTSSASS